MKRALKTTEDGSHTFYSGDLDEPYHSMFGAIRESEHVFIGQGFQRVGKSSCAVLEIGLGTGLNLLLTFREALKQDSVVFYHAVEKYPLTPDEYLLLNHEEKLGDVPAGTLRRIHEAPWETHFALTEKFSFFKERADIRSMNPSVKFDLVYFDAFAPDKQPEMWTPEIFSRLHGIMQPGGIWVSYTSKGSVKRDLVSCGFEVKKVPGPPGKKEMLTAIRR